MTFVPLRLVSFFLCGDLADMALFLFSTSSIASIVDRPGRAPGALRGSFVTAHAGILPEVSG